MEILALIVLTMGTALSLRWKRLGVIAGIASILLVLRFEPLLLIVTLIALMNLISLDLIGRKYGTVFALPALMLIATVHAFYTSDLPSLIVCFIVASVPTYALVLISEDLRTKTAIKYVTFMVTATILFVLGLILIYENFKLIGSFLLLTGLALEVGIAPLHEWVPDVFSEADPISASIIASLAKFVPFLIAFRVLGGEMDFLSLTFLIALAVISMFVGNIGGLTSNEPSRILAYSTIANMGYVISALAVNPLSLPVAFAGAFIQLLANSVGKVGFFTAIKGGANRLLSFILSFSMIGVPPLLGFWGKFFIATSLLKSNLTFLAIILVVNSVMSVPYYVRLARFFDRGRSALASAVVGVCVLISLTIYPNPIYYSCLSVWR